MADTQDFRIEIEEVERLYEQFQNKGGYHLGDTKLTDPLDLITVDALTDGNSYTSITQIPQSGIQACNPLDFFGAGKPRTEPKKLPFPQKTLEDKFKVKRVKNTVYVLDKKGKPEYEIRELTGGIEILFGEGSAPVKKIGTLDEFVVGLNRYVDVIETLVNGVYVKSNAKKPDIAMYWRPSMVLGPASDVKFKKELQGLKNKIIVEKPDITFEDIGGQEKAKQVIQGLSFALKNPDLYKKWGTRPPKGILLHGPPGTGKTLMVKALAREADANFYNINISDITSKWYGESEKLMQAIFDLAKQGGKTIIYFDELDAFASLRDYSHEATGRMVSTMLENLDGLSSSKDVMVIGSTNRLNSVDPALTRPGRIDRLVEVPLPDSAGRKQIFEIHKKYAEKIAERKLFSKIDPSLFLERTIDYSGADIAEIVRRALEEKVRQEGYGEKARCVNSKDIEKEIDNYERTKKARETMGFHPKK